MGGSAISYIENDIISVGIKSKGAEWCSLIKKNTGQEYLWQADPQYWGRSSCILFPTIGMLKDGQYQIGEHSYMLEKHGFLRNKMMVIIEQSTDSITFCKPSDAETLLAYPFKHEVIIKYQLDEDTISITYEVYNYGDQIMPFSIGAHPAFNVPLNPNTKRSDYSLRFNKVEPLQTMIVHTSGLIGSELRDVPSEGAMIPITDDLFDQDALVLSHLASNQLSLIDPEGVQLWTLDFTGFPYLGIWSKNQESPFVCIEPWHGIADLTTATGNLYEKKGIETLAPSEKFTCVHKLTVH
jgi:galactose mutarotase-like enzyme